MLRDQGSGNDLIVLSNGGHFDIKISHERFQTLGSIQPGGLLIHLQELVQMRGLVDANLVGEGVLLPL